MKSCKWSPLLQTAPHQPRSPGEYILGLGAIEGLELFYIFVGSRMRAVQENRSLCESFICADTWGVFLRWKRNSICVNSNMRWPGWIYASQRRLVPLGHKGLCPNHLILSSVQNVRMAPLTVGLPAFCLPFSMGTSHYWFGTHRTIQIPARQLGEVRGWAGK